MRYKITWLLIVSLMSAITVAGLLKLKIINGEFNLIRQATDLKYDLYKDKVREGDGVEDNKDLCELIEDSLKVGDIKDLEVVSIEATKKKDKCIFKWFSRDINDAMDIKYTRHSDIVTYEYKGKIRNSIHNNMILYEIGDKKFKDDKGLLSYIDKNDIEIKIKYNARDDSKDYIEKFEVVEAK